MKNGVLERFSYFDYESIQDKWVDDVIVWTKRYTITKTSKETSMWINSFTPYDEQHNTHGTEKYYYKNGQVSKEFDWKNGKQHGNHTDYWSNGITKSIRFYENGVKVDTWRYFNRDGFMIKEVNHDSEGRKIGNVVDLYDDGSVKKECFYRKGQLHGQWITFDKGGQIFQDFNYDKGRMVGLQKFYHPNGVLREEYTLVALEEHKNQKWGSNNKRGRYIVNYPDGTAAIRGEYKNGYKYGIWTGTNTAGVDWAEIYTGDHTGMNDAIPVTTIEMMKKINATIYDAMTSNDLTLVKELCKIFQYKLIEDKYFVKV